jgi:hypothetical protein
VALRDEQRRLRPGGEAAAAQEVELAPDGLACDGVQRHDARPRPLRDLCAHVQGRADLAGAEHVVDVEAGQLGDAQAGVADERQHAPVADAHRIAQVDLRQDLVDFFA